MSEVDESEDTSNEDEDSQTDIFLRNAFRAVIFIFWPPLESLETKVTSQFTATPCYWSTTHTFPNFVVFCRSATFARTLFVVSERNWAWSLSQHWGLPVR